MSNTEQQVYVVDDDADVRDSLQWLLESVGLKVHSCESAQQFFQQYDPAISGCLVMDVRMPGLSGLAAQERLQTEQIDLPVIMISAHGNIDMAVTAMSRGAMTFLEKPFNDQQLLDFVHNALEQDQNRRLHQAVRQQLAELYAGLTRREKQVLELIVRGMTNNDVAEQLSINRKTFEGHRANMMTKMQANSLPELIQMAVSLELLGEYGQSN